MKITKPKSTKNKLLGIPVTIINIIVFIAAWSIGRLYPLPVGILAVIYFSVVIGIAINKYRTAKESVEDVSTLKKEVRTNVVWLVIIALILGLQVWSIGGFQAKNISSSPPTLADLASQGAQGAKSSTALPSEIDSVTTLTDITSESNIITYHYMLHDADTSSLTDDVLRSSIQPNVCSNTSTKNLLDNGVDMQYLYSIKENGQQYSFTVTKGNC